MPEKSQDLTKFLRTANAKWAEQSQRAKEESGFNDLEPGRYIGHVFNAELTSSKKGVLMAVFHIRVLEGDSEGEEIKRFRQLGDEDALMFFGKDLMVFGYDPEDVTFDPKKSKSDEYIENVLTQIVEDGSVISFRAVEKNGYINYNFEELQEDYEIPKPKKKAKDDDKPSKKKNSRDDDEDEDEDEDEEEEQPKKGKAGSSKPSKESGNPSKSKKSSKDDDDDDDDDDEDEEEEKPKKSSKKPAKKSSKKDDDDDDDEEEEDDDDDHVMLALGMTVKFTFKGEKLEGTIKEILDEDDKVKVKVGNKIYPISSSKITGIVDDED